MLNIPAEAFCSTACSCSRPRLAAGWGPPQSHRVHISTCYMVSSFAREDSRGSGSQRPSLSRLFNVQTTALLALGLMGASELGDTPSPQHSNFISAQ